MFGQRLHDAAEAGDVERFMLIVSHDKAAFLSYYLAVCAGSIFGYSSINLTLHKIRPLKN